MPELSRPHYSSLWDDQLDSQPKNPPRLLPPWQKEDSLQSRTLPHPNRSYDHRPKPDLSINPSQGYYDDNWSPNNPSRTSSFAIAAHPCNPGSPISTAHQWGYPTANPSPCSLPSLSSSPSALSSLSYSEASYAASCVSKRSDRSILRSSPGGVSKKRHHTDRPPPQATATPTSTSTPTTPSQRMMPKSVKSEKERGRRDKHNRAIDRMRRLLPESLTSGTKTDVVESGTEHIRAFERDVDVVRDLLCAILNQSAAEPVHHHHNHHHHHPAAQGDGTSPTGVGRHHIARGPSHDEICALRSLVSRGKHGHHSSSSS
ncbi:MAG: hypothetical protein M1837_000826 [Sclerophora amabilis]|nr:MAG: hypothetical protein M1837_000826 [Sclerophora amabilis]